MSQEKLIRLGKLQQLEQEMNVLAARSRAGLYVLRGVFADIELRLDPSRFVDLDLEMIRAVIQDLQSIQEKHREVTSQIKELREDLD